MGKFEIAYLPKAVKQFSKLPKVLQDECILTIALLKDTKNHEKLKVHKLHGILKKYYSASIDRSYRIVFTYENNTIVIMLIGDHSVYS